MENKFYVGQRVKDPVHIGETEGIVIKTDEVDCGMQFPIRVSYGGEGTRVYTKDGRYTMYSSPSLIPLDPPRTVLTEWQRKQLMKCSWLTNKFMMDDIESILSTPEPPQFVPKEGEAVLVDSGGRYLAGVFTRKLSGGFCVSWGLGELHYDKVFPFDASLVGKVTD